VGEDVLHTSIHMLKLRRPDKFEMIRAAKELREIRGVYSEAFPEVGVAARGEISELLKKHRARVEAKEAAKRGESRQRSNGSRGM
jgi:hypothetical protein